ncbi:MAG TPA: hypothetical protein VGS21_09145, partial [Acidimicrobiales bacterium]|nr:hypothetical protein [Acidimicrobiales bacterium]
DRQDGAETPGTLLRALREATATDDLAAMHQAFFDSPAPAGWARHAPLVLEHEPEIVVDAANALAGNVAAAHRRLVAAPDDLPVVLAGGLLSRHSSLAKATSAAVYASLPRAAVVVATEPPVSGAVRLAEWLVAGTSP